VTGIGGEADLVVDDDVDGAVSRVVGQVGQVERLEDDALAAERGVAVQEDRHNLQQPARVRHSSPTNGNTRIESHDRDCKAISSSCINTCTGTHFFLNSRVIGEFLKRKVLHAVQPKIPGLAAFG